MIYLGIGVIAFGQTGLGGDTTKDSSLSSADKHFVKEAAEGGLAEVELGNLAENKASSQEVKDFAQRMVKDHSKANDQLKETAQKIGVSLPGHPSPTQMAEKKKLETKSGADFDRAYMSTMVNDHRQDVAAFKHEAANGKNVDVKSFASNTLPTLQEHLGLAEKTDRAVAGSTGAAQGRGE